MIKLPTEPIRMANSTEGCIKLSNPVRIASIGVRLKICQHKCARRAWELIIEPNAIRRFDLQHRAKNDDDRELDAIPVKVRRRLE